MMPLTGASSGSRNVVVTNPYGQTDILTDGFSVTQGPVLPPVVDSLIPNQGKAGTAVCFNLTGSNFDYLNVINLSREGIENI